MRVSCFALAAALLVAPAAGLAGAQSPVAAPAADPQQVVAEVRRILAQRYVLPERRPALDAVLAEGLASGRYDVAEPAILAERINADLERVGRDRHLGFVFDPRQAGMLTAPPGATAPDAGLFEKQVRAANHGVSELRLLPGNVRYMAYDGFMWIGPETEAALETAMRFLKGGDAIIIDIRRNGGGDSDASRYLLSHFLLPNQPLYTYYRDGGARVSRVFTLPDVPAGRMLRKPLYVLTSDATASAAEEFAGNVRGYRIGELVGEKTGGAGYANALVPIDGRFVLSVSTGRVVLASTGRDWEAAGHTPTIPAPVEAALDVAHAHAVHRLGADASGEEKAMLEAIAEGLEARFRPLAPTAPLAAYEGAYGERRILLAEGSLWYRRGEGQPQRQLLPLGGNRFTFKDDPAVRISFDAAGGRIAALQVGRGNTATPARYERTR